VAERWHQIGVGSAVALAAWLVYELTAAPRLPEAPAAASDAAAIALPSLEIAPPDLATLRATLERPLFDDDRRPDLPDGSAASEVDAGGKAAPVRLSAIVVASDGGRMALVKPEGQDEPQRVRVGEAVAGWKVAEISDEAVTLTAGDQRVVVPLRVYEPPPARPQGRKPPRRRTAETARQPVPQVAPESSQGAEAPAPAAGGNPPPAAAKAPTGRRN